MNRSTINLFILLHDRIVSFHSRVQFNWTRFPPGICSSLQFVGRQTHLFVICSTHIIEKLFHFTDPIYIFKVDITIKGWQLYFHSIVPLLLIISTSIPRRTTMIPKDSFCTLIVLTVLSIIVSLLVPVWTTVERSRHSVIMLLFVITIGLNHDTIDFHHENQGT